MAFKVLGGIGIQQKLKRIPRELDRGALQEAVRAGAVPIQELMSAMAPRGPDPSEPNISNVVVMDVRRKDPGYAGVWIGPEKGAFYAIFHEFGTKHLAARPFASKAVSGASDETKAALAEEVWNAIEEAIR